MLKRLLRPTLYLLISILIGTAVTLVMDSFVNVSVEKRIRRELKQEIEAAAISFKEFAKTASSNEVLLFLRKFSSSSLSNKIVEINHNDENKMDSQNFSYLFTYKEGNDHIDYYILNSFLSAELAILDTPEIILGVSATIALFIFIILYDEKKKQAVALSQQLEVKHKEYRKVLEEQEALALLGRMVATLAHELKTPIATISNLMQTLPIRIYDKMFTDRFIILMNAELNRTKQLMDNLLIYGKEIEVNNEEWTNLVSFVSEMASKNSLQSDVSSSVKVYVDRFYFRLLFENILRNSRIAGANRIQVKVCADRVEDNALVTILVEDNGKGFPIDTNLDALLNPFITFHPSGAGLGLYLASKIAAAHNGKISLYRLEHGAGVSISLPQERARAYE